MRLILPRSLYQRRHYHPHGVKIRLKISCAESGRQFLSLNTDLYVVLTTSNTSVSAKVHIRNRINETTTNNQWSELGLESIRGGAAVSTVAVIEHTLLNLLSYCINEERNLVVEVLAETLGRYERSVAVT
jgi:hypothetical protein